MKGYSHALSASAGWVAVTSSSSLALGYSVQSPEIILAGTVLAGGAGMWPDMDHRQSTIAWSLPPFTKWLTAGVENISGGHRHGTHSWIGIAVTALVGYAATLAVIDIGGRSVSIGGGILAVLLTAFAVKVFGLGKSLASSRSLVGSILHSPLGPWILSLATAGLVTWYMEYDWAWLTLCLTLGAFIHCLGDSLTIQGVPWLWPWNPAPPKWLKNAPVIGRIVQWFWPDNGYFRFPILGSTGGAREAMLASLFGLYVTYGVIYEITLMMGSSVLP